MTIAVVGLNYRTTPVEIREKLTLAGCAFQIALEDLKSLTQSPADNQSLVIHEGVLLSTCNRLEIYVEASAVDEGIKLIKRFISKLQNLPDSEIDSYLYQQIANDAIQHLMRVACGLDSMILGEAQVLGQVTQAFEDARAAALTGPILSHLFTQAIHTGKRARAETPISRYTTSVSHAGTLLLLEKLPQRAASKILIIGAGEMAVLAAQALRRFEIGEIAFVNRTYNRAEALASDFEGKAMTWYQLHEALAWADAVVCATGAPHTILYRSDLEGVASQRTDHPLVIVDIAVPRDVEDGVRELPNIQYFDIDDLQSVVDANVELRKAAVPEVEAIIQQEMARFLEWYRGRQVTPVIKNLRDWAQNIADEELLETLGRLSDADERTRQIVSRMAHRLVNRLLHEPTSRLKMQANVGNGYGYAHAVRELFALADGEAHECLCNEGQCGFGGAMERESSPCNLQCILPYATGQTQ